MPTVIIRDDDTNATTPIEWLDRLYRPFLDRGMPVNLSIIPEVRMDTRLPDGEPEGFLRGPDVGKGCVKAIGENKPLVEYLKKEDYCVAQHGLTHEFINGRPEFDQHDVTNVTARLLRGKELLESAGLGPAAFVAPQDKMSREALRAVARRHPVISAGWYERRRLPYPWLPRYAMKKLARRPHWYVGRTILLTHPGCILSRFKEYGKMLERVREVVLANELTVLVTHWWEYFPKGEPDEAFIAILHSVADFLGEERVQVGRFDHLK
jgi:hypothetical protein